MLEAAAFLLPTITSRFFDGPAFISPLPPLIKADPLTLYHEKGTKRTCWQKRRIKSQFLISALSVSETCRYLFSKRPKLITSAGWWRKETVSLSWGKNISKQICTSASCHLCLENKRNIIFAFAFNLMTVTSEPNSMWLPLIFWRTFSCEQVCLQTGKTWKDLLSLTEDRLSLQPQSSSADCTSAAAARDLRAPFLQ